MIVAQMCVTSTVMGVARVTTKALAMKVGQAIPACPNLAERDKLDALPERIPPITCYAQYGLT